MPIMTWTEKLSVGVPQFDAEHKQLVALLNELFDAMQQGKGREKLGRILDGLVTYTRTHFANEEAWMRAQNYPDYPAHRKLHETLTTQVVEIQQKYRAAKSPTISMEALKFLQDWLTSHIQGTDKEYAAYAPQPAGAR